jgi:DNA-nicking Smr family endonuclease
MAKRARRDPAPPPRPVLTEAPLVSSPFRDLGKRVEVARKADEERRAAERRQAELEAAAARARAEATREALVLSDEDLFAAAVAGSQPVGTRAPRVPPPRVPRRPPPPAEDRADAEVLAQLYDLVDGRGTFDIADTDEYIEGAESGLDRNIVQKLRRGDWAVQAHLDLHGLTRHDARDRVSRFVDEQRKLGNRCVLIIHGRGLNSKDQIPVLKERLRVWLSGRLSRAVLAFATARPADGGAGAVYVLLRKAGR